MLIPSKTSRTLVLTALLLAGGELDVAAQEVPSTFPDLRNLMWNGETLSVTDRSRTVAKGRVLKITDDAITLLVHGQPRTVDASDVTRITRRRAHASRGALIGLSVGASLGIVTGLVGSDADKGWALLLGAMFGGIGGGIGTGIGAAIHSDEICTRRPGLLLRTCAHPPSGIPGRYSSACSSDRESQR